jgi:Alpha/beta hydrolase domain
MAGIPATVQRDGYGLAVGGIRLPLVEVPIAHNSAIQKRPDAFARLVGRHEPFSDERVRALYADKDDDLARVEQAARAAEKVSVVLPRDVGPLIEEAAAAWPL